MAFDSKLGLAGTAGTSVLRNRFSVVARISDWIIEIFGTSYKILGQYPFGFDIWWTGIESYNIIFKPVIFYENTKKIKSKITVSPSLYGIYQYQWNLSHLGTIKNNVHHYFHVRSKQLSTIRVDQF